jgi:integrase
MFNLARRQWKWKVSNPVTDIMLPDDSKKRVRYLSVDEYKRLYEQLDISPILWLEPIVNTAIGSGLREGNLINLQKNEVKLDEQSVEIDAEKMKNDEYLGNPLSEVAFESLRSLIESDKADSSYVFHDNGEKLYDRKVQRAFAKVVSDAGIEDFHFHDLRHCFGSYLRQNGVPLDIIVKLMNHKDSRMTQRYAHLNVESLRGPMKVLDSALLRFYDNANK